MKTLLEIIGGAFAVAIVALVVIRVVPGVAPAVVKAGVPAAVVAAITGEAAQAEEAAPRAGRSGGGRPPSLVEGEPAETHVSLRQAELALERSVVRSPIDGVLGLVEFGVGDYVNEGDVLVTVDDRRQLVIEFRAPERFASRVSSGLPVRLTSSAMPGQALTGEVSAVGSRLDESTRTLTVEAVVDNTDDLLRPGMSFGVELEFGGTRNTAVPPLAIQWDSDGSYVWTVTEDKAQRVGVEIVQRESDAVLVETDVAPGQMVLTAGVLSLQPGAPVKLAEEPAEQDAVALLDVAESLSDD